MWSRQDIDALYRRAGYAVFNRARQLVGNEAEAREIAQDVFAALLERPDAYQAKSSELGFLFAIATHLSLTRLRARCVRGADWEAEVTRTVERTAASSAPADRVEAKDLLLRVMRDEDPVTVEMVQYHYVEGLSQDEVAKLVGLSRVTVNQRLMGLRERAREQEHAS